MHKNEKPLKNFLFLRVGLLVRSRKKQADFQTTIYERTREYHLSNEQLTGVT